MKSLHAVFLTFVVSGTVFSISTTPTDAQKGSLLMRRIPNTYMQTNPPEVGAGHVDSSGGYTPTAGFDQAWPPGMLDQARNLNDSFANAAMTGINQYSAALGATFVNTLGGSNPYGYGWKSLTGELDAWIPRPKLQQELPYTSTDPATGMTVLVDEQGHVTYTEANGNVVLEYDLMTNFFGEMVGSFGTEDGTEIRVSEDAYALTIDPDGINCVLFDGIDEFPLELDEDGYLVYTDEDGYSIGLIHDEEGVVYVDDSDGILGVFDSEGYDLYDENDELIETGEIENDTLEDRVEEFEDLEDGSEDSDSNDQTDEDGGSVEDGGEEDDGGSSDGGEDGDSGDDGSGDDGSGEEAGSDDGE